MPGPFRNQCTANVVGIRGHGWHIANSTLKHQRRLLGDPNRSLDSLLPVQKLLHIEGLDGWPLMQKPLFRDRFILLKAWIQAMRLDEMRMLTGAGMAMRVALAIWCLSYYVVNETIRWTAWASISWVRPVY